MSRTWLNNRCPDCKQIPKRDFEGKLSCACEGKHWTKELGTRGTLEEEAKLKDAEFELTTDTNGDVYHVGPFDRIVWLYADNTWEGYPPPQEGNTLDDYLKVTSPAAQEK